MKMPKILFFIAGMAPTEEESTAIAEIGMVGARNVSMINDDDNPEKCDAVAGDKIPKAYEDKPVVKSLAQAVNLFKDQQRAENEANLSKMAQEAEGISGAPTKAKEPTAKEKAAAAAAWKANA